MNEESDYHQEAQAAEVWNRMHNEVLAELQKQAAQFSASEAKLLTGLLEITNFMLKNTCGIGSNFKLAECAIAGIDKAAIRNYYVLVLSALAYYFGQLLPAQRELAWRSVVALCGEPEACAQTAAALAECKDHQTGDFSPVRAGRKVWESVAVLLKIHEPEKNTTGRVYYQSAPGQDLVFLAEQAGTEGWFPEG